MKWLRHDTHGFSLIELLVIVVILASLSAIAVPVYINQQNRTDRAVGKTTVARASSFIAGGIADGTLTGDLAAGLSSRVGSYPTAGLSHVEYDVAAGTYCVTDGTWAASQIGLGPGSCGTNGNQGIGVGSFNIADFAGTPKLQVTRYNENGNQFATVEVRATSPGDPLYEAMTNLAPGDSVVVTGSATTFRMQVIANPHYKDGDPEFATYRYDSGIGRVSLYVTLPGGLFPAVLQTFDSGTLYVG